MSEDLEHWEGPYTVLEPEDIQTHFYYLLPVQYEGIYIGLLLIFKTEEREIQSATKMNGLSHIELCYSPNGICWQRIQPGQAWIPHGEPGENDGGGVAPRAVIRIDEEIRIYYLESFHQHNEIRRDCSKDWRMAVASLRKDGFVSLDAGKEEGSVTSRVISSWTHADKRLRANGSIQWTDLKKGELIVNVKTDKTGYIKAELLDEHWNIIEGYSREDSIAVSGDHLDAVLRWKNKATIEPLDRIFRVRLLLKNAKVYSFSFS